MTLIGVPLFPSVPMLFPGTPQAAFCLIKMPFFAYFLGVPAHLLI